MQDMFFKIVKIISSMLTKIMENGHTLIILHTDYISYGGSMNFGNLLCFKRRIQSQTSNVGHFILKLFDISSNFSFAKRKLLILGIISKKWSISVADEAAEGIKTQDLRKLGNSRKISKLCKIIAQCPIVFPN